MKPQTPLLTVDIVIELRDIIDRPIVLISRKNPPLGWALPGGFVDVGETVEQAAIREAKEETGLDVQIIKMIGVYSDPRRDPRGHAVSIAFAAFATGTPKAADDAASVDVVSPHEIAERLVFDHSTILDDYVETVRNL